MPAYSHTHLFEYAELLRYKPATPTVTQTGNVAAFLDKLAYAEGTLRFGNQDGFNVIVGGKTFNSTDDRASLPPSKRVA